MATVATTATTGQTGAGGGSIIRITGMASGLDVDSLVTKMLSSDQIKVDSANKANQTVQWKKDAYTSIISGINSLQTSFFDVTSPSTSVLSDTAYSSFDTTGMLAAAGTVSADGTAQAGNYSISFKDPVTGKLTGYLASDATVVSNSALKVTATGLTATNDSTLSDIGFTMGHSLTISYDNNDSLGVQIKVIPFTPSTTLSQLTTLINNTTGNSVTARYSELTGKLSLQTSVTGGNSTINVTSDAGVIAKFNFTNSVTKEVATSTDTGTGTVEGLDAKLWITPPGGDATSVTGHSSNNFTLDGVSYNLTSTNESNFSVVSNPQKVYDKISGFLDKYNALVDQIQTAVNAKTNSDYPPLTTAQQAAMSATDIANWNTKAQVGVLSNDTNLTKMLNDMRSAFTNAVSSAGLTFGQHGTSAIGIDTSTDVTQGGKMTIVNKTDLMNSITNHPDQVQQFFAGTSTATDIATNFSEKGIFSRLNDIITSNVGMIGTSYNTATLTKYANVQDNYSTTGGLGNNTLPDQLYYQQQLVTQLNASMAADSTKYYNQFSALEVAMSNMSAQMTMLSNYSTS